MIAIKRLKFISLLLFLCCSCDRLSRMQQPVAAPSPFRAQTATELFDLQSKCTAMGEKIKKETNSGDVDLAQEQVSHYNQKDNRCYVKLSVSFLKSEDYKVNVYLFDGQSGEMLASVRQDGEKKIASVFDTSLKELMQKRKQSLDDNDAINDLIDSFVATDRKQ